MNIRDAALIAVLFALLERGEAQSECGYLRGVIRLQGGRNAREGRLEVCNDGVWGRVCDGGWDEREATVACRQLGLLASDTVAVAVNESHFGEGSGSAWWNDLNCSGTEARLEECLTEEQQRSQWVALQCDTYAGLLCLETDGGESVRLVGGRDGREGRVEVFWEGEWGTVCGSASWGTLDAGVVCRQLGLLESGAIAVNGNQFATTTTTAPALVGGVGCSGDETLLFLCAARVWGRQQCAAADIAGVVCTPSGGCSEGEVRLAGGRTVRLGRVEVCHGGVWGTVCKEDVAWNDSDANIVCRRLGFQEQDEIGARAVSGAQFGQATGVIWLFTTTCDEHLLPPLSCSAQHWASSSCSHSNDVAVLCPEPKQQFHACANVAAQTLFTFDTLYEFYNSVAAMIVGQVLAGCSQPCSYTVRDFTFDSSVPSPIHPTTMCLPRNATLSVRLTCRYRPYLNENGRVQLATYRTLGDVGIVTNCAGYRGFVNTKDIDFEECNLSKPTTSTQITGHGRVVGTEENETSLLAPVTVDRYPSSTVPINIALTSVPRLTPAAKRSTVSLRASLPMTAGADILAPTSSEFPGLTRASISRVQGNINSPAVAHDPRLPQDDNDEKTESYMPNDLRNVMIGLLVATLVLLVLCVLVSVALCVRRRSAKKSGVNSTNSPQNSTQIQSFAAVVSSQSTSYYEDMDVHEYAVLEQTQLPRQSPREGESLSSSGANSTGHENVFLSQYINVQQQSVAKDSGIINTEKASITGESNSYSKLHMGAEYAVLEPALASPATEEVTTTSGEYSQLSQNGCVGYPPHEYQRVLPDSTDYDRTFTRSISESSPRVNHS